MTEPDGLQPAKRPLRLLLGLTGSAGLMSMSAYLEHFRGTLRPDLRMVLTPMAERLVPKSTWVGLAPQGVLGDADWISAEHVGLADWADAILVAPCTANTLSSVAHGRCDNLLTATIMCAEVPVVLAPNMNRRMWAAPAVRRCVETARADGHVIIDMQDSLAYEFGTRSTHHDLAMARPDALVDHIRHAVSSHARP